MLVVSDTNSQSYQACLGRLNKATKVIALTGAGISTVCGLRDFRSSSGLRSMTIKEALQEMDSNLGVREDVDGKIVFRPMGDRLLDSITPDTLRQKSHELFYDTALHSVSTRVAHCRFLALMKEYIHQNVIHPSKTHKFLSWLAEEGTLLRWYTANIDGLEVMAGQKIYLQNDTDTESSDAIQESDSKDFRVLPLHGTLYDVRCDKVGHYFSWTPEISQGLLDGYDQSCPRCPRFSARGRPIQAGNLLPGIVLYQQPHPYESVVVRTMQDDLQQQIDFFFILGSSLTVPGTLRMFKQIAQQVRSNDGCVVLVGHNTPNKDLASNIDFFVQMDCDLLVEAIYKSLQIE